MARRNNALSGLDGELELYMGSDYESGPSIVYEKISGRVDYINDSRLTRKPVANTPVELTFEFDLTRKRLTISAKQTDIQYVYDVREIEEPTVASSGKRLEGWSRRLLLSHSYMTVGLIDAYSPHPGYLVIQGFRTKTPSSRPYEGRVKHDRYILDQSQVQKLKVM